MGVPLIPPPPPLSYSQREVEFSVADHRAKGAFNGMTASAFNGMTAHADGPCMHACTTGSRTPSAGSGGNADGEPHHRQRRNALAFFRTMNSNADGEPHHPLSNALPFSRTKSSDDLPTRTRSSDVPRNAILPFSRTTSTVDLPVGTKSRSPPSRTGDDRSPMN